MITENLIQTMKERLEKEYSDCVNRSEKLQKDLREVQENGPDPLDVAQSMDERKNLLSESNRIDNRCKAIRKALNLISEGEYGYCESCDADMNPKRLEIDPATFECIECKTLSESRERTMGRAL